MKKFGNKWIVLLVAALVVTQPGIPAAARLQTKSVERSETEPAGEDARIPQAMHIVYPTPEETIGVTRTNAPTATPVVSAGPQKTVQPVTSTRPTATIVPTTPPASTPTVVPSSQPMNPGSYVPVLSYIKEDDEEPYYTLTWTQDSNRYLDHYEVYSCAGSRNGQYTLLKSVDSAQLSVHLKERGKTVFFKVRAVYGRMLHRYVPDLGFTWIEDVEYGAFSEPVGLSYSLEQVEQVKISKNTTTSLNLSWKKVAGAEGYVIERSESKDEGYETIVQLEGIDQTEYTDEGLQLGRTYYYRIYAYVMCDGVIMPGMISSVVKGSPLLKKTGSIVWKCPSPHRAKVSWNPVDEAKGYVVYKTGANNFNWKKYKVLRGKNNTKVSFGVSNGKCYGVRVIAYCNVTGSDTEGAVKEKSIYGDYYGYAMEDYSSRQKRVYGSVKAGEYKSSGQAQKHMTTIKVKVWDFASGMSGRKITKTKYLTCNKGVAPTLKKIFQKIYHGKEKAPIYELGCYSWRTGQHGQGLAVDINSNYNAMFDNGKPTVGKCWKPKKYAYSIKRNGDIENAFAEYGFSRGLWGSRKDYMHFSYFGV